MAAYDLAQNPLTGRMVSLDSREGWAVHELVDLERRSLRLDALCFDPDRQRFEMLVLHFVDEAQREGFLQGADLSRATEVRRI